MEGMERKENEKIMRKDVCETESRSLIKKFPDVKFVSMVTLPILMNTKKKRKN
jgi:hypothetical protein